MSTMVMSEPGTLRLFPVRGAILGGIALIVGGAVQADGGILTAAYRGDSPVSEDLLQFPWHGASAVATTATWGVTQVLITVALIVFARSRATGARRSGQVGAWLTVAGSALFILGHAVTLASPEATIDGTAGTVIIGLFGVGTLLIAVGFVLAGAAMARGGAWSGWRRLMPLAVGVATVALTPLQFTALLPVAVAVYSLTIATLGVAMVLEAQPDAAAGLR